MSEEPNPYSSPQEPDHGHPRLGWLKSIFLYGGAVLSGYAFDIVNTMVLFPIWMRLGWRRPVQDWLISHGLSVFASFYGLLWVHSTDWLLAMLFGILIGMLFPVRWRSVSLCGGISFAYSSWLAFLSSFSVVAQFGLAALLSSLAWQIPEVLLVMGPAFLASRVRNNYRRRLRPAAM